MAPFLQGVRHSSQIDGEEVAQSRASNLHRGPSTEPLQPLLHIYGNTATSTFPHLPSEAESHFPAAPWEDSA